MAFRRLARTRLLLVLLATGCVVFGALLRDNPGSAGRPVAARAPVHGYRQESLLSVPAAAQGAISAGLGEDSRAYWVTAASGAYRAASPGQRLALRFTRSGVSVTSHHGSLGLAVRAIGHGTRLHGVGGRPLPHAAANRVSYALGGGVREWYANGPLGLEQGFDLKKAPLAGGGPLTLSLAVSGNLRARLADRGVSLTGHGVELRYAGLVARDARGRKLRAWLELRHRDVLIRVDDRGAHYPLRIDPWVQSGELTAGDATANAEFGDSVAVSGNTVVVGAPHANGGAGAVYVFTRGTAGWANATQTAELTPSDPQLNKAFGPQELGASVAIDGSTIVAGAPYWSDYSGNQIVEYQGAVYVWTLPKSGAWANATQTAMLSATDLTDSYYLGYSVAIQGSTIVAGAPEHTYETPLNGEGAVYVYTMPASGGWVNADQTAELSGYDNEAGDALGASVSISGSTIVAGAPFEEWSGVGANANHGGVYVWTEPPSGVWGNAVATAELIPSDLNGGDELGTSVAISGSTIAAGAPDRAGNGVSNGGAVYVWTLPPLGGWNDATQPAELTGTNPNARGVGTGVAISGATIFGGGGPSISNVPGVVYEWTRPASGFWADETQSATLTPSDSAGGDLFGDRMAISGSTLVTSAFGAKNFAGTAYVYGGGYTVSGSVLNSCGCGGIGGISVLVTGTATDGSTVSVTGTSAAGTGAWSVQVPPGTYTAGPSDDGSTFDLPGFHPEPTDPFVVSSSPVDNVDFETCAGPDSSGSQGASGARALSKRRVHSVLAHAEAPSGNVNACTSVYTLTVGGKVPAPHRTIVDPGPGARFNENNNGDPDYRGPTPFFSYLDSYPAEAPECMSRKLADRYGRYIEWYSYFKGPVNLPKYTVQFAYDQQTEKTSVVGTPEAGEAEMSKYWVWHVIDGRYRGSHGRCHLEKELPFMYLPVPSGSGFYVIEAWGFPFDPTGVLDSLTKNEYVEAVEQLQEHAPSLVTTFRRQSLSDQWLAWLFFKEALQHVALHFLTLGESTSALLGKGFAYAANAVGTIAEGATTLGEIAGPGHALYEGIQHYFTNAEAFETGEAIMSTVIHGSFDTYRSKRNPPAVVGTALGVTVKGTRVPTLSLAISRSAYQWPGQKNPAFSGPLPWTSQLGSKLTPYTANPFGDNAYSIIGSPYVLNIGSGKGGLANLTTATQALPAVNQAIHEGGLYQNLTAEENSATDTSCPTPNNLGLELSPSVYAPNASTMCWLFKDGDA